MIEALSEAGITESQLEIYSALVNHGQLSVSEICTIVHKDKAAVYKHLEKLLKLGLVDRGIGASSVYLARQPQMLKEHVNEAIKSKYSRLMSRFSSEIDEILNPNNTATKSLSVNYKLIFGRKKLYRELSKLFDKTYSEYRLIMSGNGLLRSIRHGLLDSYIEMAQRGIKVMVISEINMSNITEARALYNYITFKHQENLLIRLNIFDQDRVLLGAIQHDEDFSIDRADDSYILIEDERLARGLIRLFDVIWKNSIDAGLKLEQANK